jgi:hypothetical protein
MEFCVDYKTPGSSFRDFLSDFWDFGCMDFPFLSGNTLISFERHSTHKLGGVLHKPEVSTRLFRIA